VKSSYPATAAAGGWRDYLRRSSAVARAVATLLVTLVALRFAVASVERALAISQSNFAETPARHDEKAPSPPPSDKPPASSATAAATQPTATLAPGLSRRMTLGVSAGPPRSDVYVNGRRVGQTPFLGDTSCKTGQAIKVEIVPPKGPPLVYSRNCTGGALEISGPPP
jgi:hypothetical protein